MLQSEKLLASIGLDIDDNEPSKSSLKLSNPGGGVLNGNTRGNLRGKLRWIMDQAHTHRNDDWIYLFTTDRCQPALNVVFELLCT